MHEHETQRVQSAIARAAEAAAPSVEHALKRAYGPAWLEQVKARLVAEGRSAGRGLHDHRFVLALVAYEPALARVFDEGQREAARKLNGMGNAIVHNESLRAGDPSRSEQLAQRLIGRAAGGRRSAQDATGTTPRRVPGDAEQRTDRSRAIRALMKEERYEEALAVAERWTVLAPGNPTAWSWKIEALYRLERHEEALGAAERWVALEPDDPEVWRAVVGYSRELGRYEETLTRCLDSAERYEEALAAAERWLALEPGDPEALELKARCEQRARRRWPI